MNVQFARRAVLCLSLGILGALPARAQFVHVWDGGGTNDLWSSATNWVGDTVPPNPTTGGVALAGTTRLTPNVNTDWTIYSLIISNGAGPFTLSGSNLTMTANASSDVNASNVFTHLGASNVVINNNIILPTTPSPFIRRQFKIQSSGSATFNGAITNTGVDTSELWIRGIGSGVGTINGRITIGTNKLFRTDSPVTWVIGSTNNQWGLTELDNTGTLRIAASDALPTNTLVQFDTGSPRLDMNNFNQTVLGLTGTGVVRTGTGAGGLLTISDLGATNTFRGQIVENGRLTKRGAGQFVMTGVNPNTYTGSTVVVEGVLLLAKNANTNAIPAGDVTVQTGAVLRIGADSQIADGINSLTLNAATLDLQALTEGILPKLKMTDSVLAGSGTAGLMLARGGYETVGTNFIPKRISVRNADPNSGLFNVAGTTRVSGIIYSDTAGPQGITKTGSGVLELSAANSYTGATLISAGSLVLQPGGSFSNSLSIRVATGATFDVTPVTSITMSPGQTLMGEGSVLGHVAADTSARVLAGGDGTPGTLTITGNMTVGSSAYTNTFDLTNSTVIGSGINDLINISGSVSPSNSAIRIRALAPLVSGSYRLINYGGSLQSGFAPALLGNSSRDAWVLDTNTTGQINLNVTAGTNYSLVWQPQANGNWDLLATANWTNAALAALDTFADNDSLLFDDSGATIPSVVLQTNVRPAALTVNASSNYIFSGPGRIADSYTALNLTKSGSGSLTLATSNEFTGGVTINGGSLVIATNNAAGNAGTILLDGGQLTTDGNSWSIPNNLQPRLSTTVAVTSGALTVNGYLVGNANLVKTGAGQLLLPTDPPGNFWTGNVIVAGGTLGITSGNNAYPFGTMTNVARFMEVQAGATVSNVNAAHNPLGVETSGLMKLIVSNGTYLVPAYNHIRELDLSGATLPANGTQVDGLDIRTGNVVNVYANPSPSLIDTKITIRGATPINVEDGPNAVDLTVGGQVFGNNLAFYFMKTNFGTMMMTGTVDNGGLNFMNDGGTTILAKASSVSVHATGASNVTIRSGAIQLAGTGDDQIYAANDVDVNGLLDMNGRNEGFDELRGTGTVANSAAATTSRLTLGQTNGSSVFAGSLQDGAGVFGLRKHGTGAITLSGASAYSGGTTVEVGTLIIDGSVMGGPLTVWTNTTLGGLGTIGGDVNILGGGKLVPNRTGVPGTLAMLSSLTLDVNSQPVQFDLNNTTTVGGGTNDLIAVTGNFEPNGAIAQINPLMPLGPGTYTLVTYGGTKATTFNPALGGTNTTRLNWTFVQTNAGQINLVVDGGSLLGLKWNAQTSTNWDNNVGANWLDLAGVSNTVFRDGDTVLFDDSGAGTNVIGLTGIVRPGGMVVNASSNYSIQGSGRIQGVFNLVKDGTGTLTLGGTANDYQGAVIVSGGVLKAVTVGFLGGNGKTIVVRPAGQINFNGVSQTGSNHLYSISGSGPDGRGAIVNTNAAVGANSSVRWLELTGDAAIGALVTPGSANENGRLDIGLNGGIAGNGFTLTKLGAAPVSMRGSATNMQLVVAEGMAYGETVDDGFGSNVVVQSGAFLGGFGSARTFSMPVTLNGGTLAARGGGGAPTWLSTVYLAADSFVHTAPGYAYASEDVIIRGLISGPGKLTKRGANALRLFNTNNYAGGTVVESSGGSLVLSSTNGPALGGNITLGHLPDGGGVAYLYPTNHNQFAPGSTISFRGSPNDWSWLKLFGTTQYVAAIDSDDNGGGVIDHVYQETGYNADSTLVLTGPGNSIWSGSYLRDSSTNASTGKLKIVQAGPGTLTLAGGKANTTFSGGIVVSNGTLNLKAVSAAGVSTLTLAGGALALDGAGLQEGSINGAAINTASANPLNTGVKLSTKRANMTTDFNNTNTWAYTGYLVVTGNAPVTYTFAESIDDGAYLLIDNTVVLNDGTHSNPTIGTVGLAPGLHRFDLRVYNGTGGAGPTAFNFWTNNSFGFGVDLLGRNQKVFTNYQPVADNGDGLFLATDVTVTNAVLLQANTPLRVSNRVGPTNLLASPISDGGSGFGVTKVGEGTLRLGGSNTYAGATTVSAGRLLVDGYQTGLGAFTVASNAALWGTGVVSAAATVQGGGAIGQLTTASNGLLTVGSLTLDSGARVEAILRGTNPTVRTTGNLGSSAGVSVAVLPLGPLTTGTHVLVDYAGTFAGSISDYALVAIPNGGQGELVQNVGNGSLDLAITNAGAGLKWNGGVDGAWNVAGTPNWKSVLTAQTTVFSPFDAVVFDDTASGNYTVTLASAVSPSALIVSNETKNYTIANQSIDGAALVKLGAARLTLSGTALTATGNVTVAGGTLKLDMLGVLGGNIINASTVELAATTGDWQAGTNRTFSGGVFRKTGPYSVLINNGSFSNISLIAVDEGALRNQGNASIWTGNTSDVAVASGATFDLRGDPVRLNALTGAGTVTNSYGNNAVELLTLGVNNGSGVFSGGIVDSTRFGLYDGNGSIAVTKIGTGTQTFAGVNNYIGNTTLDAGTLAYAADNPNVKALVFGSAASTTNPVTLDLTSASVTAAGLTNQINSATTNIIVIGAGRTLTITGGVTIGSSALGGFVAQRVTGGGAFVVVNSAGTFRVSHPTPTNNNAVLDLAQAGFVRIDLGNNGTLSIGTGDNTGGKNSSLLLGQTNEVIAGTINLGASSQGSLHSLVLGSVSNRIFVNTFNLGTGLRDQAAFMVSTTGSTLILRDAAGTGRANVQIGPAATSNNTAYGGTDTFDVTGNNADLLVGALNLGNGARNGAMTRNFNFNQGTMDVQQIRMAAGKGSGANICNFNIGGGTVTIGTNGFNVASNGVGNLSFTGGTIVCGSDILRTPGGSGSASLTLDGASLDMSGRAIGGATAINTLNFRSGTLANVGEINNGATLTKTTTGTLVLAGTNLFSGPIDVQGGRLLVNGAKLGPSNVTITSGTLGGTGSVAGFVISAGSIAPGASAGILTCLGDCLTTGSLDIELGGTNVGSGYDRLVVVSNATLDGVLNVTTINGFVPVAGNVFTVLTANAVGSTFGSTSLPAVGAGEGWKIDYLSGAVVLSVTGGTPVTGYDLAATVITNGLTSYQDDADGDGYANLLEYVTGGSLTNAGNEAKMQGTRTNGLLALRFNRDTNAVDATIVVEGSTSAANSATWLGIATNIGGSWGAATNVVSAGTNSPLSETVYDTETGTNRFLRLRVTRP